MNFEFPAQINPDLQQLNFDKAISIAQTELRKIPQSQFHNVLDKSLVEQADDLAYWVENFYDLGDKEE